MQADHGCSTNNVYAYSSLKIKRLTFINIKTMWFIAEEKILIVVVKQ